MSSEPIPTLQEQAAAMNAAREVAERKRVEDHPLAIAERMLDERDKHRAVIAEYRGKIASTEAFIAEHEAKIADLENAIGSIASEFRRRTKSASLQLDRHFLRIIKRQEKTVVKEATVRAWMQAQLRPEDLAQFTRRKEIEEIHLPSFKDRLRFNEHGEAFYGDRIVPGIKKIIPAPDEYVVKIHDRDDAGGGDDGSE